MVQPLDIERLKRQRKEAGLLPGSVNLELTVIKAAFNKAVTWQLLSENPAKTVKKLPRPEGKTRFLSPEEQSAILAIASPALAMAVKLATLTGLRRAELCQLRWEDINWERGTLTVAAAFSKTGKSRTLPISPQLRAVLQECQSAQPTVLLDHTGSAWQPMNFADHFRRTCKTAISEGLGPHTLRHTFAS